MHVGPITVAETSAFARAAEKLWGEEERTELIDFIARNPEAGDVIQGTGVCASCAGRALAAANAAVPA